jgi:hypothetical protein
MRPSVSQLSHISLYAEAVCGPRTRQSGLAAYLAPLRRLALLHHELPRHLLDLDLLARAVEHRPLDGVLQRLRKERRGSERQARRSFIMRRRLLTSSGQGNVKGLSQGNDSPTLRVSLR